MITLDDDFVDVKQFQNAEVTISFDLHMIDRHTMSLNEFQGKKVTILRRQVYVIKIYGLSADGNPVKIEIQNETDAREAIVHVSDATVTTVAWAHLI